MVLESKLTKSGRACRTAEWSFWLFPIYDHNPIVFCYIPHGPRENINAMASHNAAYTQISYPIFVRTPKLQILTNKIDMHAHTWEGSAPGEITINMGSRQTVSFTNFLRLTAGGESSLNPEYKTQLVY